MTCVMYGQAKVVNNSETHPSVGIMIWKLTNGRLRNVLKTQPSEVIGDYGMNLQYRQYVRQLRGDRDWSWEQPNPNPRVWLRRPVGELPPVSWGGGHDREDLVQDRLHAQNRTWSDDSSFYTASNEGSHHSFISLSDDDSGEVDLGEEGLLELLERAEAPVPVESVHRGLRGWASFPPGSRLGQERGPFQPHPTRRSDWWGAPSVPLYTSVYNRPRSTAWWDSVITRQPMILRSIPVREDREPDPRVDRNCWN